MASACRPACVMLAAVKLPHQQHAYWRPACLALTGCETLACTCTIHRDFVVLGIDLSLAVDLFTYVSYACCSEVVRRMQEQ